MVSGENGLFVWVYSVVGLRLDFGIQYSMVSGENGLFVWVYSVMGIMLVLLCLTPLNNISVTPWSQFNWWKKTTDLSQVIGKLDYILFYRVHLAIIV